MVMRYEAVHGLDRARAHPSVLRLARSAHSAFLELRFGAFDTTRRIQCIAVTCGVQATTASVGGRAGARTRSTAAAAPAPRGPRAVSLRTSGLRATAAPQQRQTRNRGFGRPQRALARALLWVNTICDRAHTHHSHSVTARSPARTMPAAAPPAAPSTRRRREGRGAGRRRTRRWPEYGGRGRGARRPSACAP